MNSMTRHPPLDLIINKRHPLLFELMVCYLSLLMNAAEHPHHIVYTSSLEVLLTVSGRISWMSSDGTDSVCAFPDECNCSLVVWWG